MADIQQKLRDYVELVKNDRKTQVMSAVGGVFAILVIMILINGPGGKPRQQAKNQNTQVGIGAPDPNEAYTDLLKRFDDQLTGLEGGMRDVRTEIGDIRKEHEAFQERTAVIFQKMLTRMTELNESSAVAGGDGANLNPVDVTPREINDPQAPNEAAAEPESLEPLFGGDGSGDAPVPPAPPERPKVAVIMPGDSVRVKLIAGVNAPVTGTPYPAMFKLVSDVGGPDGSALPLGEARLIAAAQGSLTDGRVLYRLTDLSMRLPNGQRKTIQVDGWIVGEDGVRGMTGRVIDQLGRALGGAFAVGATQGLGQAISSSELTSSVSSEGTSVSTLTGDAGKFAFGNGLSSGAAAWSKIIQDRVKDLVPVVEVLSGREATAIFAKSVTIEDLFEQIEDSEIVFASLD